MLDRSRPSWTLLCNLTAVLFATGIATTSGAEGNGPKGPKAGLCEPGDALVCHLNARDVARPICADTPSDHVPGHDGDYLADADGDGATVVGACAGSGDDCDDSDAGINPGAVETCDGEDDDCDGSIDEGFDQDGDSFTTCGGDCQDGDPSVNPGAAEVCGDGVDNNCDGNQDEGFDQDSDGFATCEGDCNDGDASINPGAVEACTDGVDNDCNGDIDGADAACAVAGDNCCADLDEADFCSSHCDGGAFSGWSCEDVESGPGVRCNCTTGLDWRTPCPN